MHIRAREHDARPERSKCLEEIVSHAIAVRRGAVGPAAVRP